MKTFYKISLALAVMLISGSAFSQESEAETTLNVVLADTYNMEIGQETVTIPMNDADHFVNGSSSGLQQNHLQITATQGYTVEVEAETDLILDGGTEDIAVENVNVEVTSLGYDFTQNSGGVTGFNSSGAISLSPTDAQQVFSSDADLKRGYHVNYSIPASKASNFLNKTAGTYSTKVIYTLMAD